VPDAITYLTASAAPETLDRKARTIEFVITTARQDRQGDIVEPKGLNIQEYLQNPVFLWAHDLESPPIGKTLSVTVSPDNIRIKVEFAKTDQANEIFELYAGGFLRCCSIGFQLQKFQWIQAEEAATAPSQPGAMTPVAEQSKLEENPIVTIVRRGLHILEALLVEVSGVPVPSNADAMCRGLSLVRTKSLRESLCKAAGIPEPETVSTTVSDLMLVFSDGTQRVAPEFLKSLAERGAQGKIPCRVELVEKAAAECTPRCEWVPIKKDDKEHVTEAKILGIVFELPRPKAKALAPEPPVNGTPAGPSRQEAPSAPAAPTVTVADIDAAIVDAKAKASAFAQSLLEIEGALA
jgi:hypothetical protein